MNKDSRENNSRRNIVIGFINHIVMLILVFATKTVFLKTIGIGYSGVNGVFVNVFFILSIIEYGVGTVYIFTLYKPIAEDDETKVSIIYFLFKKIYKIFSGVVFVAALLVIPFIPLMVDIAIDINKLVLYYLIYLSTTTITNLFLYNQQLIIADQKESIRSLYLTFTESASFIIQIITLILTKSFTLYLIIALIKSIIFNIIIARKTKKLYPFLREIQHSTKIDLNEKRTIYFKIKDSCLYRLGWVAITSADNIIISIIVGTIWVGYYANYKLIVMGVLGIVHVIYSAVSASVGNMLAKENAHNQYNVFKIIQVVDMWLTAFTTTSLIILTQHFITIWIGDQYLFDFKILLVIIVNFYLECYRHSVAIFLQGYGIYDKIRKVIIIAAILNIVLSVVLGKLYGVFGVLLATNIVIISTYYWFEVKFLYNEIFKISVKKYFFRNLKSFGFTVLCVITTYFITHQLDSQTISSFGLKVIACLTVPNILFLIVYRKNSDTKELVEIMLRSIKLLLNRRNNV